MNRALLLWQIADLLGWLAYAKLWWATHPEMFEDGKTYGEIG